MNKFEQWKAQLTIEEAGELAFFLSKCDYCPAKDSCSKHSYSKCRDAFQEWGESDAE